MPYCYDCGTEGEENYCIKCGAKLPVLEEAPETPPQPEEPIPETTPPLPPPPEVEAVEQVAPVVVAAPVEPHWMPLAGRERENAEMRLKEYKRKLNKGYKSGKLTKEQCQARVKNCEVKLGLEPPE